MKFVCDNCHAQYVINDEKVGPNGVSVKCKKCQHKIVVKRPAALEEDRDSTIVMQNPIAGELPGADSAPTEPVTTQQPAGKGAPLAAAPSIPVLGPVGAKVPATPFETGPTHGAFDDDIGRAFDSVMTAPGVSNPLMANSLNGKPTVEVQSSPWDAPPPGASEESGDRDSTRVVDLTNLAGLTAQTAEGDKKGADDAKGGAPAADATPVSEWYVAISEEQVGPMTVDGVKGHWEKGELSADSLVWKTGMGDWKPLSSVPELAHLVVPVPKPQLEEKKEPPAGATAVGAQAAAPGVAASQGPDTDWKPSAASALASLVKEELEALQKPPPKAEPESKPAAASAVGGLLDLPEDPAPAPESASARSSLEDVRPPQEPAAPAPIAERTLPRRREPVAPRARTPMPAAVAPPEPMPAAKSNGAYVALGIGGGLLGIGAIAAVLFMTVFKATPVEPTPPALPPVAAVAPPVAPPVAVAPPVTAPPQPAQAQPAQAATAAPAEPGTGTPPAAVAEAKQEAPVEPKKEEKAPEPAKVAEPEPKEPARVATRERRTTSRKEREPERQREPERAAPPPQPREEVATAPSRSKVDDDFERIFGGGGASDAAPAPKEEKKSRTAYVPPPVGGATKSKLEQSDIMEVVVGNKSAIKRCVEEQKSKEPGASGTIVMRWIIKPDGRTANIQTMSGEFKKTPMSSCMAGAIKGWKFPAYAGSQMPPIDFPFKF